MGASLIKFIIEASSNWLNDNSKLMTKIDGKNYMYVYLIYINLQNYTRIELSDSYWMIFIISVH